MLKISIIGCAGCRTEHLKQLLQTCYNYDHEAGHITIDHIFDIKDLLKDDRHVILILCHPFKMLRYLGTNWEQWASYAKMFIKWRKHEGVIPIREETLIAYPSTIQNFLELKLPLSRTCSFDYAAKVILPCFSPSPIGYASYALSSEGIEKMRIDTTEKIDENPDNEILLSEVNYEWDSREFGA